MWQIFTDMKDVGHSGASRPRTYVIFARKDRVMLRNPVSLFETITERIAQVIQTRPRDYLTADQLEIDLDAAEVARARGINFRPGCKNLSYLLTVREQNAIEQLQDDYRRRFGKAAEQDEDLCLFLGDSPDWTQTWSAISRRIPTFRRNVASAKMWFPAMQRWMTPAEKFLGYKVRTGCCIALCC